MARKKSRYEKVNQEIRGAVGRIIAYALKDIEDEEIGSAARGRGDGAQFALLILGLNMTDSTGWYISDVAEALRDVQIAARYTC